MNLVLVDTSVWSLVFRKKELSSEEEMLKKYLIQLIDKNKVIMMGCIRQEILSGISNYNTFTKLKESIKYFIDARVTQSDYELAAEFSNLCRSKGIQGSHTDYLICAVAFSHKFDILTLDKDFNNYKKYIDIQLIDIEKITKN